jgi:hypothetical protein
MRGPTYRKLCNDCRHDFQNFSVSSIGDVSVVVDKDSVKESWDNICSHHLEVISFLNVSLNQLQDLLLDRS